MAHPGGRLAPDASKRMMPNRCLEIPRNEITSRFCLDNGLLIDMAGNAAREVAMKIGNNLNSRRGPVHSIGWLSAALRRVEFLWEKINYWLWCLRFEAESRRQFLQIGRPKN
jgi:hypothetical protein